MSEAPEKIWMIPFKDQETADCWARNSGKDEIQYIRADLVDELVEALEKLAKLGNGDQYGNSVGNEIAKAALAKVRGEKDG